MALTSAQMEGDKSLEVIPAFVQGQQDSVHVLQGAENVSIGTMATTVVSGNYNYNLTVVNNHYISAVEPLSCEQAVPVDKILAWLKGPDFLRIYEEALSQRLSKTGVWFIESEEFRQFVEGRDVIVWGTGMPGAGKTLLSSTSMEHLKEVFEDHQDIAIICAFIRYTEHLSACDILAGLLQQLVVRHPCASRYMGRVFTQNRDLELREQGLVKALWDIARLLPKVFIIIDGLDEADDAVKDALLRSLPTLGANILIMSRPLELFTPCVPDALHISIEARTEDIDRFIDDQIQRNSRLRAVVSGDPTLVEKLKARVRESSKGMFLVARLQMEDVIRKARSANTLLRELDHLPSGVDAIYEHTLARIGAQSEEDASIAYRVFIWLVYARHTIHTTRLKEALAISFENKSYDAGDVIPVDLILSLCGGLVISEAPCRLRPIHYTAYEYLKGIKFPGLARPHTYLAVSCLVYLQYCNYQTCKEDQSLNLNAQPLCWYAEINWGYHARNSQDEDVDIHPYILTFLRTCGTHYQHSFERDLSFHQLNGLHLAAIYGLVKVISTRSLPFLPGRIYSWRSAEWIKGQTPFHYAVKYGGTLILKVLLDCYTGINEQDARGETALMTAAFSTCDGLQDRGGDWEPCIPRVKDQVEIFRTLAGAPDLEVDLKDADGRTAFMIACMLSRNEHSPITLLTMRPDINPNLKDNDGMTAFMYACKFGTRALAAYMLDHWADAIDPNEVDNSGKTALMHFCSNSRAPGAGTFSFYVRSEHETREFLEILLHHGCDPHARDISGRSAMHWAVAMESKWMRVVRTSYALQYLLGIGSLDCNQRDDKGVTTLMLASVGSLDSLQALLSHPQIDVNVQDEGGKTALHWCCRSGIPEALEMLLSHPRVNRHITDQRGLSALDFACARWGLHGVNAIYILAKSGHWEDSAIRRAVIQFFARQYGTETSHKSTLISPQQSPATFGVFEWTLDDPTTWVLLGYALRDTCRFAAYLVLVNCGILPPSKTVEEEKRYCHCPVVSELQCCSRSWGSWALETQRSAYWRDEYAST